MRILMTNLTLAGRTGTEIVTRDLALGLKAAGDTPVIYTPRQGELAEELKRAGITVISDLAELDEPPDLIHGHHHVETLQAIARFPNAPTIFVVHDATAWHDVPPILPQIVRYAAVDMACHERLVVRHKIPEHRVRLILNAFDPARFPVRTTFREKPARALVFSNYAGTHGFLEAITAACAKADLPLDVMGSGMNKSHSDPGRLLVEYDIVFGVARCAIEAIASGAGTILTGRSGTGPLVTGRNVVQLRPWNFGHRVASAPHDPRLILAEIKKYNASQIAAATHHIREHATLPAAVAQYRELYREALSETLAPASGDLQTEAIASLAQRVAHFEAAGMPAFKSKHSAFLPGTISRQLKLKITEHPKTVNEAPFTIQVRLANHSEETLGSLLPYPVFFSYRWIDENGNVVVTDGKRTPLPHLIEPRARVTCPVEINPPASGGNGKFQLRITLVQEGVMWFDQLDPALSADAEIKVQKSA